MGYFRYKYAPHNYDYKFAEKTTFNGWVNIPDSVRTARNTFRNDSSLNSPIKIGNNVTTTENMFYNCRGFRQNIDLPFDQGDNSKLTNASHMFDNCTSIQWFNQTINNFFRLENISALFSNCTNLKLYDSTFYNAFKTNNISKLFYNCIYLNCELNFNAYAGSVFPNVENASFAFFNTNIKYTFHNELYNRFTLSYTFPNLKNGSYMFSNFKGVFNCGSTVNYIAPIPDSLVDGSWMFANIGNKLFPLTPDLLLRTKLNLRFINGMFANLAQNDSSYYYFNDLRYGSIPPNCVNASYFLYNSRGVYRGSSGQNTINVSIVDSANMESIRGYLQRSEFALHGAPSNTSLTIDNSPNFYDASEAFSFINRMTNFKVFVNSPREVNFSNLLNGSCISSGGTIYINTTFGSGPYIFRNAFSNIRNTPSLVETTTLYIDCQMVNVSDANGAFRSTSRGIYINSCWIVPKNNTSDFGYMFYGCPYINGNIVCGGVNWTTTMAYNMFGGSAARNAYYTTIIRCNSSKLSVFTSSSVWGSSISWTRNDKNNCSYNTSYNIYIYNDR